eukprot:Opistho-2@3266
MQRTCIECPTLLTRSATLPHTRTRTWTRTRTQTRTRTRTRTTHEQLAGDTITTINRPSGNCAICLTAFHADEDDFMKTECFHYFHKPCYAAYAQVILATPRSTDEEDDEKSARRKRSPTSVPCPVCRVPVESGLVDASHASAFHSGQPEVEYLKCARVCACACVCVCVC